jgi:hypothetical protein
LHDIDLIFATLGLHWKDIELVETNES